jgi:hypothetical protein
VTTAHAGHRHTLGITRRELLQVGFSGLLGIGLSSLLTRRALAAATARSRRARSVVLVFLTGAPSHIDTFDMKPDAPAEVRGEFKPIATKVPGIQVCEHLPRLAARTDRLAIVRSLSHRDYNHLTATHQLLTGNLMPGAVPDKIASRADWPCYAGGLDHLRPRNDGVPSGVNLPTFLMEGPLTWPGQHAGFLGSRHDPWQIRQDPNLPTFRVEGLGLPEGFGVERLESRRSLLDEINRSEPAVLPEGQRFAQQQELAFSMLTSGKVAQAFRLEREPDRVRDRYGRHTYGQTLLLARRLVEAGVPVVQANMGIVQTWDSHGDIFNRLKNKLLPPLDQAVTALLDDLAESGLLDETLVMVLGEFGRAPKLTKQAGDKLPGRDHWAPVFSAAFAGAGVRGGQVIGRSDEIGGFPATTPYSPADVGATVYQVLGVDPATEVRDQFNRPVRLNEGTVMQALFA